MDKTKVKPGDTMETDSKKAEAKTLNPATNKQGNETINESKPLPQAPQATASTAPSPAKVVLQKPSVVTNAITIDTAKSPPSSSGTKRKPEEISTTTTTTQKIGNSAAGSLATAPPTKLPKPNPTLPKPSSTATAAIKPSPASQSATPAKPVVAPISIPPPLPAATVPATAPANNTFADYPAVSQLVHGIFLLLETYGPLTGPQLEFNLPEGTNSFLLDTLELLVATGLIHATQPPPASSSSQTAYYSVGGRIRHSVVTPASILQEIQETQHEWKRSQQRQDRLVTALQQLTPGMTKTTSSFPRDTLKALLLEFPEIAYDPVYVTALRNLHIDIGLVLGGEATSSTTKANASSNGTSLASATATPSTNTKKKKKRKRSPPKKTTAATPTDSSATTAISTTTATNTPTKTGTAATTAVPSSNTASSTTPKSTTNTAVPAPSTNGPKTPTAAQPPKKAIPPTVASKAASPTVSQAASSKPIPAEPQLAAKQQLVKTAALPPENSTSKSSNP